MLDTTFWKQVASCWIVSYSPEQLQNISKTVNALCDESDAHYQKERSILDELLDGIDEEDDDGY